MDAPPVVEALLDEIERLKTELAARPAAAGVAAPAADAAPAAPSDSSQNTSMCDCHIVGDLRWIASSKLKGTEDLAPMLAVPNTYAIGMPDKLNQEILVLNSTAYTSFFDENMAYHVKEGVADLSVAFLVHATVPRWKEIALPGTVVSFQELEEFVGATAKACGLGESGIPFRLEASAAGLRWFVVGGEGNGLPDPKSSFLRNKFQGGLDDATIEGFGVYSTRHRGDVPEEPMATSPTSNIHLHFRSTDPVRPFVGHLDEAITLLPGGKVYLPDV